MTGQTWDDFTSALADDLTQMRVLDTRIYTTTGGRYVQVQALPDHITLQTVSNTSSPATTLSPATRNRRCETSAGTPQATASPTGTTT